MVIWFNVGFLWDTIHLMRQNSWQSASLMSKNTPAQIHRSAQCTENQSAEDQSFLSLWLSSLALKWSEALDAHTGRRRRRRRQSPLQWLSSASRCQFSSWRMDGGRKCRQGRLDIWEPDWGWRGRKREERGRRRRGERANTPTWSSLWSSIGSELYPEAHCSTAGYSHPGQLSGKVQPVNSRYWQVC